MTVARRDGGNNFLRLLCVTHDNILRNVLILKIFKNALFAGNLFLKKFLALSVRGTSFSVRISKAVLILKKK